MMIGTQVLATLAADNFVVSFNILHSITYYIRVHNIFSLSFPSFFLSLFSESATSSFRMGLKRRKLKMGGVLAQTIEATMQGDARPGCLPRPFLLRFMRASLATSTPYDVTNEKLLPSRLGGSGVSRAEFEQ